MKKQRDIKASLGASLHQETKTVEDKFSRADVVLQNKVQKKPSRLPDQNHTTFQSTVIRYSVSVPQGDFNILEKIKKRYLKMEIAASRSEIHRVSIHALDSLSDAQLLQSYEKLEKLKPGRHS